MGEIWDVDPTETQEWIDAIEGVIERIIVISSINGQKGQMGQVNYSAAMAGDIGFVRALAQESVHGVM